MKRDDDAVLAERLTAQLLAGRPARDPVAVAERLLAVQGQDQRGFRLAVRARTTGLSAADVDQALTADRSLVVTWLNRGTLHLVRSEDYPWLHALTTSPRLTGNARRLSQLGISTRVAERAVAAIERSLAEEGPLTGRQLGARLEAIGVPTRGQALVHLLMLAGLRALTVRGPMVDREHAYVLVRDWLGVSRVPDRDRSLAELARRYLTGHGPAGERDLARWAGLPLRDARAGLQAIGPELEQRADGLVVLARRPRSSELPPPRLLGAFDPLLLGWTSREQVLGANDGRVVGGGLFRPFALVRGRGVAVWKLQAGQIEVERFARLASRDAAALRADADEVLRFLGTTP
jgi:DNA glycosylase AlkZ-like